MIMEVVVGARAIVLSQSDLGHNLENILGGVCSWIDLGFMTSSLEEAVIYIEQEHPEIVFVHVSDCNAEYLDVFEIFPEFSFETIVILDDYKPECIKRVFSLHPIGVIMMPLKYAEVKKTLNGVLRRFKKKDEQMNHLEWGFKDRLAIAEGNGFTVIVFADILYCESNGNYTFFYTKDKGRILATKNIGHFDKLLPENMFYRIHKKYIVNISYIEKIYKNEGSYCKLVDKTTLVVSRRKQEAFIKKLQSPNKSYSTAALS